MTRCIAGYLLTISSLCAFLAAGQNAKSTAPQVLRTFQLVATNSEGQPILDLKPGEIQASDEGKRHPLAFLRLLRASAAPAPALGSGDVSNRSADRFSSSVLILLDLLNANLNERGSAWDETIEALAKQQRADSIFLILLTPDAGVYPVRSWTAASGLTDLTSTTTVPSAPVLQPWTVEARQLLDQALKAVERVKPVSFSDPANAVRPTYQGLILLGRQYAAMPGQKRIIWVSHGIPTSARTYAGPVDFLPELKKVTAEYNELGIAVYTVHQIDSYNSSVDSQTLQTFPPLTGGRWFEQGSIGPALAQAQADSRGTYLAGYYVPAGEVDGKLHKLRASASRTGVRILAPSGYTAIQPEQIGKIDLNLVRIRPFDTPDIGFQANLDTSRVPGRFQIRIDLGDLFLQRRGLSYTGSLAFVFIYLDEEGKQIGSSPINLGVDLSQEQFDAATKDGYPVTVERTLPAETRKVRILAQDPATGIAGSLTVPIPGLP